MIRNARRLQRTSFTVPDTVSCILDWFGDKSAVEVLANSGEMPLLGIGLLIGHRLNVDYTDLLVSLE